MEHILHHDLLALLEQPQTDLRDTMRLFLDKAIGTEVITRISDDQVRQFWTREFPSMNYKTAFDGVAPIANKLGAFLAHPVVRSALTEPVEPLRFRKIMNDGQILIVNLAKGQLGGDIANVMGGLILSGFAHAAFSRHTIPEQNRRPFFLYVDEFHAFTTGALADMVSELRKYGLSLTLANQYLGLIQPEILDALLGNVGSLMSFRVSPNDALDVVRHLDGQEPRDLIAMPNFQMPVRLMIAGERPKAFTCWGSASRQCGMTIREHTHSPSVDEFAVAQEQLGAARN